METAIIIVLAFMLLIAVIILIDIDIDRKGYKIIIQDCNKSLYKSNKQNEFLKSKNDNLKKIIEEQESKFKEYKKYSSDSRDLKITELETKYQSALQKIIERDQKIRDRDSKIIDLEKTKKEYSARVYQLQSQRDMAKHEAIDKANQAVELCNEMANKFKSLNLDLESIESQLLGKLNL